MDPDTLETFGLWDFDGQVKTPTFTAHPKFDPDTGEMVCFGYEAGGDGNDGSCDVVVYTIDKDGKKTEEAWYKAPYCGMIHDCAITKNWIILPMTPLECNLDRLKEGGNHWEWNPKLPQYYGVAPRHGGGEIKWFSAANGFQGHIINAHETNDGKIMLDINVADGNTFYFFRISFLYELTIAAPGEEPQPKRLRSAYTRWIFDPCDPTETVYKPFEEHPIIGEFSRVDDRFVGKPYNHFFACVIDPTKPFDAEKAGPLSGGISDALFNCYGHFNWRTNSREIWWAGPTSTVQEPVFIPRTGDAAEGDGFLMGLVNRLDEMRNDLVILDTALGLSPVAIIRLPMKLRVGLHGNFVPADEIEEWKKRN
jgi:carotenoid cleavage dioxygenase